MHEDSVNRGVQALQHEASMPSSCWCLVLGLQVLWNVATGEAICGSPTHQDFVLCCRFFNTQNDKLITAGNYNLQIWTYDAPNNKLRSEDVKLGNFQRQFRSLVVSQQDKFAYVGSTSGDVMQVCCLHQIGSNTVLCLQ